MHTLDPAIGYLLISAFSLMYFEAAYHKWSGVQRFSAVLTSYQLLPLSATAVAALLIPCLESGVAIGLWLPSCRATVTLIGISLFILYAFAIALNLYRGRRDLDCGCSGPFDRRPIAPWMVVRNVVFAGLLATSQYPWQDRDWTPVDGLTVIGGLFILVVLYRTTDQLLSRVLPAARRLQGVQ
jgi:hypothetical protein